jgi:integrase
MTAEGSIVKRCGCRDPHTGRMLGARCPKLRRGGGSWNPSHGVWHYQLELPPAAEGRRRQLRRGGLEDRDEAIAERNHARYLLTLAGTDSQLRIEIADLLQDAVRAGQPLPTAEQVGQRIATGISVTTRAPLLSEYLPTWLTGRRRIDANTRRTYESHIRVHLIPHLGHIPIDKLTIGHIQIMFTAIEARNREILSAKSHPDPAIRATVKGIRPTGPATCQRIRATLRKALNDAITARWITFNPAAHIEMAEAGRAKPRIWTPERVAHWQTTGQVPGPVMVWTPDQTGRFLDYAAVHDPDLHPLLHLIAYRGLRRGEACGLLITDVHLTNAEINTTNQLTTLGHTPVHKKPKSEAGDRTVALDTRTTTVLRRQHHRHSERQLAAGPDWPDTGLFFTRPDGQPWHPNTVSARFKRLTRQAGLPPIRLHDLRHVAATIARAAGVDIKILQDSLGHSTSTLTRDTYESVLPELTHAAAEATAALIPMTTN